MNSELKITNKKNKTKTKLQQTGFGLIEILIVGAIIGVGFLAIISFLVFSRGVSFQITRNTEATSLAEEGMEAVRKLRDAGWTANIATQTSGTNYYPVIDGDPPNWTLSISNPGLINNLYTRTVVFADVYRDGSDNIASSGTLDANTKKLTVTVSWQEDARSKKVVLTTYITNFLNN